MTISFSYENFPHLWDLIIASADHNTQLALRRLSRALPFVIDRRQAEHLVLYTEGPEQTLVTGVYKHHAHFREDAHVYEEPAFWMNARTRAITARTRVLDIQGYCPPVYAPDLFEYMHFPALEVLRLTHAPSDFTAEHFHPYVPPNFTPKTVVLFSDDAGTENLMEHWWFQMEAQADTEEEHMVPTGMDVSRKALPKSVTKVVVNVRGEDFEAAQMWPFAADLPAHVKELVIVAPRYTDLDDEGHVGNLTPALCISDLLSVAFNPRTEKVLFVGFERMPQGFVEAFEGALRAVHRSAVYTDVDYSIDDELTLEMSQELRESLMARAELMRRESTGGSEADGDEGDGGSEASGGEAAEGRSGVDNGVGAGKGKDDAANDGNNADEGDNSAETTAGAPETEPAPLSYKQKVDQMLAGYEFVSKAAYVRRVGEETAALELLEYLDPGYQNIEVDLDWRRRV